MQKQLLEETKIGESLAVGAELEDDEVGLFIASADVSSSCAFKFDEWRRFVDAVNDADAAFRDNPHGQRVNKRPFHPACR